MTRVAVLRVECNRCKETTTADRDPDDGEPVLPSWGQLHVKSYQNECISSGDLCKRCVDALKHWMKMCGPTGLPLACAVEGCKLPNIGRGAWCIDHTGDGT